MCANNVNSGRYDGDDQCRSGILMLSYTVGSLMPCDVGLSGVPKEIDGSSSGVTDVPAVDNGDRVE